MIALLHFLVVDVELQRKAVNIERGTRAARLRDLEQRASDAQLIADPQIANFDAARGDVLSQRTVEQRVSALHERIDDLGGDDQDRLRRAAVDTGMRVKIALDPERRDETLRDGALRKASRRNTDLYYRALHKLDVVIEGELVRMRTQPHSLRFVLALVIDVRLDQLFSENIAAHQEPMIVFEAREGFVERAWH